MHVNYPLNISNGIALNCWLCIAVYMYSINMRLLQTEIQKSLNNLLDLPINNWSHLLPLRLLFIICVCGKCKDFSFKEKEVHFELWKDNCFKMQDEDSIYYIVII